MSALREFVLARFDEEEKAIKDRDLNLPIHFVGCYYYSNTLDAGLHCDCDEDGEASKKELHRIKVWRDSINAFTGSAQDLIVRILAAPYSQHPDYPG